jgi:hypothetical protein
MEQREIQQAGGRWQQAAAVGGWRSASLEVGGRRKIGDFIKGQMNERSVRFVTVSFSSCSCLGLRSLRIRFSLVVYPAGS